MLSFLKILPLVFTLSGPTAPAAANLPPIVFPDAVSPVPAPTPAPKPVVPPKPKPPAVPVLAADELYVLTYPADAIVLASPPDAVKIVQEEGPVKIRGKFFGGSGKFETRTFTGKTVVTIEVAGKAAQRVELIVIPVGATKADQVGRKLVDLLAAPDETPKPDIAPKPKPVVPVPVTSFRVIFASESGQTHTKEQLGVIYGKAVEDYLNANCTKDGNTAGWRRYDPQQDASGESPTMKALWSAVQPKLTALPCIVIEVNGKADILPLSANPADQIAVLKKYREGK